MNAIADRLRDLTRPTGEEELLNVDFPRVRVPPWLALVVVGLAGVALLAWLGISRSAENPYEVAAPSSEAAADIVVAVVGEVEQPGLVTLAPGARINDALEVARPRVPTDNLNLAQKLNDGEQITVGGPPNAPEAIIAHREEVGSFSSVEQLMDVSGIGPAKFAKLKDKVRP